MSGLLRFPNINSVTISGRLVRDVELKFSQNNVASARICIAVNHYYRDEYGNQKEEASFVDTVAFGKTAQICHESMKKGSPVLIEGNLRTRTYTDQNNISKKITEVIIYKVYPLERDENYIPNQNYQQNQNQGYNNHSYNNNYNNQNYNNQQQRPYNNNNTPPTAPTPPPTQTVPPEEPETFPSYEQSYSDLNTENDVPF